MLSCSIREVLLSCHESFIGTKKGRRFEMLLYCVCFGLYNRRGIWGHGCWVVQLERSLRTNTGPLLVKRGGRVKRLFLCLFWSLWQKRNMMAFDNYDSTDQIIKKFFFIYYLELGWIVHWGWFFIVVKLCELGRLSIGYSNAFSCLRAFFILLSLYIACILLFLIQFLFTYKKKK